MDGFEYRYSLGTGDSNAQLIKVIIANSAEITKGDAVDAPAGYLAPADAGDRLLGIVENIVTKDGVDLNNASSGTDYDGTFTSSTDTYTAAADNQTDKQVSAIVRVDPYAVYANTPDATIGTTTGSNLIGYYSDIVDEDQIDESKASTSAQQFFILGTDPNDSSKGLYMIAEHMFKR